MTDREKVRSRMGGFEAPLKSCHSKIVTQKKKRIKKTLFRVETNSEGKHFAPLKNFSSFSQESLAKHYQHMGSGASALRSRTMLACPIPPFSAPWLY